MKGALAAWQHDTSLYEGCLQEEIDWLRLALKSERHPGAHEKKRKKKVVSQTFRAAARTIIHHRTGLYRMR